MFLKRRTNDRTNERTRIRTFLWHLAGIGLRVPFPFPCYVVDKNADITFVPIVTLYLRLCPYVCILNGSHLETRIGGSWDIHNFSPKFPSKMRTPHLLVHFTANLGQLAGAHRLVYISCRIRFRGSMMMSQCISVPRMDLIINSFLMVSHIFGI